MSAQEAPPIKIAWIGPLTGNAAVLGTDAVEAVRMVIEQANQAGGIEGRRLELLVEDDQMMTAKTLTAYERTVRHGGAKIVIIYGYSGLFALADRAAKEKVLLLNPLDCDDDIAKLPESVICIAKKTEDLGYLNAETTFKAAHRSAAILFWGNDAFQLKLASATRERFEELGGSVPIFESYPTGSNDFRPSLLKSRAAKINALVLYGGEELGTLISQARQLLPDTPIYTLAYAASPQVQALAGQAIEGVIFARWRAVRSTEFERFSAAFKARVGRAPILEESTVPSFDIAELLMQGLPGRIAEHGAVDVGALRLFFLSLNNYRGAAGPITIDPDGITRSFPLVVQKIVDGESVSERESANPVHRQTPGNYANSTPHRPSMASFSTLSRSAAPKKSHPLGGPN